jgi:hypothetical protein
MMTPITASAELNERREMFPGWDGGHLEDALEAALFLLRLGRSDVHLVVVGLAERPTGGGRIADDLFVDLLDEGHESLLYVAAVLGRGFDEGEMELIGELLARGGRDDALGDEIALVAHKQLNHVAAGVPLDLRQPLAGIVEAHLIGDIVHEDDAMRPPVVAARDGPEPLLAG